MANDYIINPMWFYFVDVMGAIEILAAIASGLLFVVIVACLCIYFEYDPSDYSDDFFIESATKERKKAIKAIKASVVGLLICAIIVCAIPNKDTFYQMMIAKFATYDNAQNLLDAIKAGTDYLVESLKAVK